MEVPRHPFGTFYMPQGRQPERFGIVGDDVPDGLVAQLSYPFRRSRMRQTTGV
ncbi:MAG TPA: hypothetical protein VLT86_15235 [Vicinamibacterales bacterium]|nr:hypothetical protein [Vicinamibacterales bacterium]